MTPNLDHPGQKFTISRVFEHALVLRGRKRDGGTLMKTIHYCRIFLSRYSLFWDFQFCFEFIAFTFLGPLEIVILRFCLATYCISIYTSAIRALLLESIQMRLIPSKWGGRVFRFSTHPKDDFLRKSRFFKNQEVLFGKHVFHVFPVPM